MSEKFNFALDPKGERDKPLWEKLKEISPEALEVVARIKDPSLSHNEFFDEIGKFNAKAVGEPEGVYDELQVSIPKSGRHARVKMFQNGRVTISGSDQ